MTFGSAGRSNEGDDILAFGASVQAASAVERQAIYDEVRAAHRTTPTAESAIRLAVASLGMEDEPATDTLALLEYAEANATGDEQRQFVTFLRPVVELLIDQQSRIESESAARSSLEAQLEALKELEEQLNAEFDDG